MPPVLFFAFSSSSPLSPKQAVSVNIKTKNSGNNEKLNFFSFLLLTLKFEFHQQQLIAVKRNYSDFR